MPNVTSYIVKLSRIGLMIWLGICLHTQAFYAQSFISNGDFETMTLCPDTTSMLVLAEGWFEANLANPDYFNACDIEGVVGVPENFIGSESAHSGSGYAGIYVAENDGPVYREFLESALTGSLMPNHAYAVSLYLSVADISSCFPTSLCIYLSSEPMLEPLTDGYLTHYELLQQMLCLEPGNIIDDMDGWYHAYFCFKATGDEHFITIGNNYSEAQAPCINITGGAQKAYVYIDDVSLTEMPVTSVEMDTFICKGSAISIDALDHIEQPANSEFSIVWNDGGTGSKRTFTEEGIYTAEIDNGCSTDTFRITLHWRMDCPEIFYFPNAFSPNNDGLNDRYYPQIENITIAQIDIYDRWGALVYSGIQDPNGWDGTVNGKDAEIGLYMYVIRYTTNISEKSVEKCGALQLIR